MGGVSHPLLLLWLTGSSSSVMGASLSLEGREPQTVLVGGQCPESGMSHKIPSRETDTRI